MKNDVCILGKNKKICATMRDRLNGMGKNAVVFISAHVRDLIKYALEYREKGFDLALIMKNHELTDATREFHAAGVFELFVFPFDLAANDPGRSVEDCLVRADNSLPRLRKIDAEVYEACNLRCKGCIHFSCLVEENKLVSPEGFERNLMRLREFFWGIESIHLLGGEPFLCDSLGEYIRIAHRIFPDSDIRVLTNGILIPGRLHLIPDNAAELNCTVNITDYPATAKVKKKIVSALDGSHIPYTMTLTRYIFFKSFFAEPQKCSKRHSYRCCMIRPCHGFLNGYISPCLFSLYLPRFNAAYDEVNLPDKDAVNIFDTDMDGWQLIDYLENTRPELCSYCTTGWAPFLWKTLKKDEKPHTSDWLIKPNVWNTMIVQYLFVLATPIIKLAYKIMHKIED